MKYSLFLIFLFLLAVSFAADVKVCCEKTNNNAWCQNTLQSECDSNYKSTPTSCEATSFCKLGCCYDSDEGVCMENTPQKVCELNEGTWAEGKECEIPQCDSGCCVLGKQASFVSLTRCKKLSSFYGLETDFRKTIKNELECISLASLSDEGACVYEVDYTKTCSFTTRQGCKTIKVGDSKNGTVTGNITFYKDYLCSAEELGSICGITKRTACLEGKDEVYFIDSCGNPANIYDATKINDKSYWRKKVSKEESCNSNIANYKSRTCGNCNYFEGSICKDSSIVGTNPDYGNYICSNLNCAKTSLGKPMRHGESWCSTDNPANSVGSRYFRHICINGEELIEPCADFRQETCIQDVITSGEIKFSQAGCRINRWQDCYTQKEKIDCENSDKRDCTWISDKAEINDNSTLACIPKNAPGLKFYEDSSEICQQGNQQCVVEYEKSLLGKKKCVKNCECLEDSWKQEKLQTCQKIADCGAKVNFINIKGSKSGFKITTSKVNDEEKSGGGGFF